MTCAACSRSIELALAAAPGVERASVNLATNTATVEYDGARIGVRDLVSTIEDLGYGVPPPSSPRRRRAARLAAAAGGGGGVCRAGGVPGHDAPRAVAATGAFAAGDLLRRRRLLSGCMESAAARLGEHELAGSAGHGRGVSVFRVRHHARGARGVFRSGGDHHRAGSAGQAVGGAGARPGGRSHSPTAGTGSGHGARGARWRGNRDRRGGSAAGRYRGGAAGRADSVRRQDRGRPNRRWTNPC